MTAIPTLLAGRYRIEESIGEGSFASTFRATDTKLLRTVAVKILRAHHAENSDFVTRFEREAQAAAQVNHPNVVQVHDYGQDGPFLFIVMHYVSGPPLAHYIRGREALSVSEIVRIVSQVLDGLTAIHERGIVHRDIKPQNILLEEDLTPKLSDFGVAYSTQTSSLTQAGMTIGTAAYMAPEQATGDRVGPRADLYSVGVVLYELLTGWLPFTGARPVQVMYQHVHQDPIPPRSVNPEISPALDAVVLRALAKRPEDRYPNAEAMRYALVNAAVDTEEVLVVPPATYGSEPTVVSRGVPPAMPPPRGGAPVAREEPARWPYAIAVLVVALAIMAVLVATLGDGFSVAGFGGDDDPTATEDTSAGVVTEPTEPEATATPEAPTEEPEAPTPTAEPPTPTEEPPTATPEPPTATPEPPTATPEPPTATPEPPTATPEAPTATPPPSIGQQLAEQVPANSPVAAGQVPQQVFEEPAAEFGRDDLVEGGAYRRPDGVLYDRPAAHLYSQTTEFPSTRVTITLDEAPSDFAVIRVLGMDDENSGRVPLLISVNGYVVHQGPSPFENEDWTDIAWRIGELDALQAGENVITIENLAAEGEFGRPPWILISVVQLYLD